MKVISFHKKYDTQGLTLVVDESDSQLHPLITRELISLFNSDQTNPENAQLIFVTNNTGILDKKYLRRDQIWFCEKNESGNTDLYSLIEFQVRHDASYGKDYLLGRYGGIPYLADFEKLVRRSNGTRSDFPEEKKADYSRNENRRGKTNHESDSPSTTVHLLVEELNKKSGK